MPWQAAATKVAAAFSCVMLAGKLYCEYQENECAM
jgi:hypothetical protein